MPDEISLYDAKARLSALVRQVREGRSIVITVHGQPAALLGPIDPAAGPGGLDARVADLERRGLLTRRSPAGQVGPAVPVGPKKAGALRRFLESRE